MLYDLQVEVADMERVAKATGARTQTTVNGLTADSAKAFLGTCKRFEEKQVGLRLF
jgi:T-complex protein 1 subunit eta